MRNEGVTKCFNRRGKKMMKRFFTTWISLCLLSFSAAASFDAQIHLVNFPQEQEAKVQKAVELIKKVVTSEEFKTRVLEHTVDGKKTYVDNNGLSNEQIYQMILDGSETLIPGKNGRMDVELELYQQSTNTIGYTYPNTTRIWVNTKYFNRYNPVQVADNLFHEWVHKLGFDHDVKYSKLRNYSVPFALGYLVEELAKKHYHP
jgi:hypothetical protein